MLSPNGPRNLLDPDAVLIEYLPIESAAKRDCHKMWQFLIQDEQKLRERGFQDLTIGAHNFDRLLARCLGNQAFKCLVVLMEYYNEHLRNQQDLPIDLVRLFARGLTVYRAPANIISKLYRFVKPQNGDMQFTMTEM